MTERLSYGSAPGRICISGENLDWMINGPSIVAAINNNAKVTISSHNSECFALESVFPVSQNNVLPNNIGIYKNHFLDFVQASLKVFLDKNQLNPLSLKIETASELPIGGGVSSSAAITLATVGALYEFYNIRSTTTNICRLAYMAETVELETGAGQMDFYACGFGGIQHINCQRNSSPTLESFSLPNSIRLVLIDTMTAHKTSEFINSVKKRLLVKDKLIYEYIDKTLLIVEKLRSLMKSFDENAEEIGHCITNSHLNLRNNICCSTPLIDECVRICLENGALGAKLTGSGMGGCLFALTSEEKLTEIVSKINKLPVKTYATSFSAKGVTTFTR